jgi:hypothetical protein
VTRQHNNDNKTLRIFSDIKVDIQHSSGFYTYLNGFGGLEVAFWPLVPKFAGSHPAEAVGSLGRKNPQHAFFRRGRKAVGPMS